MSLSTASRTHSMSAFAKCFLCAFITIAAMTPAAWAARPLGIDVSYYQGNLSQTTWNNVAAAGRSFAFIRCVHYGVSGGDPDPYFPTNMVRAKAAGMLAGAYSFARPSVRSPQVEADYFVHYATQYWTAYGPNFISAGYLRPVLDLEEAGGTTPVGATNLSAWANAWLDAVEAATGVEPIVYCNSNYAKNYLNSTLANRTLWIANYTCSSDPQTATPPAGIGIWSNWVFWQYCSSLAVAGISPVDTDVFNGTAAQLQNYVIVDAVAPVISNAQVTDITANSATITWTTSATATSQVQYGLTSSYGSLSTLDSTLVTSHSVALSGLAEGTTYHCQALSTNTYGSDQSDDLTFTTTEVSEEIVIDNTDSGCTTTGSWISGTLSTVSKIGDDYLYVRGSGSTTTTSATCRWTPTIPAAGSYNVYVYYQIGSNRNTAAPYTIVYNGGTLTCTQNQYASSSSGGWFQLNSSPLPFAAGTAGYVEVANNTTSSSYISADAAKFVLVSTGEDTQAPTVPTGLTATAASTTSIQLSWTASTDNTAVSGYKIYRNGSYLASSTGTSYLDSSLTANTSYSYQVSAYDAVPNESSASTAVSRATLSVAPVSGSITASVSSTCLNSSVTWTAVGGFGAGKIQYYRYKWDQSSSYTFTGSETSWSTGTIATQLTATGTWYLHVQGYNVDNAANGTCNYSVATKAATTVTQHPQTQSVWAGSTVTFSVTATGEGTVSYQWQKGGVDISGATSSTLQLTSVTIAQAGEYRCVVTAGCGSVTSNAATLTVNVTTPADFDKDYMVDSDDFSVFSACMSGALVAYDPANLPTGCTLVPNAQGKIAADFDLDGDVDQEDFGVFQRCLSGTNAADPNCAN